jgi:hypothetical protein
VLWTSQRRAENDLPGSIDGAVPAAVTSLETFHLRIPSGAQFGASPGALGSAVVASRDLGFTASAATNLHVLAPAGRFDIRGVQWLPWTPPPKSTPSAGPGPVVVQIRPVPGTTPDRDGLTYRFQPDRTPTLELVAYNFSDAETAGVLEFHGPQDWITEGPVSEHLRLAPGMAHVRRLSLLPGAKVHSQDRYPVSLEWTPESGRGDSLRAFVAPSSSAAEVVGTVPWRPQWEADPPGTSWRLAGEDLPLRLELSASPAGEIPGLVTPLPEHVVLRGDDVIRIRARTVSGLCASGLRLELVTPARVVTYGVHDGVIGAEVVEADFRVADLEPAFWSRADPERRWRPEQIRYLRLQFGGLARGSIVEVGTPQIRRRPR